MKIVVRGDLSASERADIASCCPDAEVVAGGDDEISRHLPTAEVVWGSLTPPQIAMAHMLQLLSLIHI